MKAQKSRSLAWLTSLIAALLISGVANAQWLTQTITVSNGWTAAYLFVDASTQGIIPTTPGVPLSAGNPIDQIWLWKAPTSSAQYLTSPASPLTAGGPWISWGQTNAQNNLSAMVANGAYLIHSTSPTPYSWRIQGQPVPPRYLWDPTGLNFIGFSTPANNPPNFQSFLASAGAFGGAAQIYQYVGGPLSALPPNPAPVTQAFYTAVNRGQAYWISAPGVNAGYYAPFQLNLPNSSGLLYGSAGGQMTFYLLNVSSSPLTVTMTYLSSEAAPAGQQHIAAAPPLMIEGAVNTSNLTYGYTALSPGGGNGAVGSFSWALAPSSQAGSEVAVTLGVNRYAMTTAAPGSLYAGILQFSDSLGLSSINIPVSALSANNTGLWVGQVSVTNVSYDLKTYAQNSDGSLAQNAVTNVVVMTNAFVLGNTTNLAINNSIVSNLNASHYDVTNIVVDTYTATNFQTFSNGIVVATNTLVDYTITTNTTIQTDATGYYFTNNNQLLVWITTNIDYPPEISIESNVSVVLVTNQIGPVPVNGTLVAITNSLITTYDIYSYLATNAIFEDPVTNFVSAATNTATLLSPSTGPAHNVVGVSPVVSSSSLSNAPAATNYIATNEQVFASATSNVFIVPQPLYAVTNGNNLIYVNVLTNNFFVKEVLNTYYITNTQVISNNYVVVSGATNLASSVTNLIASQSVAVGSETSNSYALLSLIVRTNALSYLTTNYLSSPASNYVVTAHNTQGDAVAAPYPLRLILFNDGGGNCSLLQTVYWGMNPDTNAIVSTVQSALDPNQLGTARRITATHLPWTAANTPWPMSGGPLAEGATLTSAPIVENYDDQAANPFLHTYHPDHNNLDTESPPHELPIGSESYTISRVISLSLAPNTNDFLSLTKANTSLAGRYNESLSLTSFGGFSKTYYTIGSFNLTQISSVSNLVTR